MTMRIILDTCPPDRVPLVGTLSGGQVDLDHYFYRMHICYMSLIQYTRYTLEKGKGCDLPWFITFLPILNVV